MLIQWLLLKDQKQTAGAVNVGGRNKPVQRGSTCSNNWCIQVANSLQHVNVAIVRQTAYISYSFHTKLVAYAKGGG